MQLQKRNLESLEQSMYKPYPIHFNESQYATKQDDKCEAFRSLPAEESCAGSKCKWKAHQVSKEKLKVRAFTNHVWGSLKY